MSIWKWCLEDDNKKLVTGWTKVGDYWYYLESNGTMKTGWYQDTNGKWYYLKDNGQMATGWIQLNDKWYYLYEATNASQAEYIGTTAYNCTKIIDSKTYKFDADGVMQNTSTSLVSDDCVGFVKGYESFYDHAYYDGTGYTDAQLTIGYGTTKASVPEAFNNGTESTIRESDACYYLKQEIDKMAVIVKADLDAKGMALTQNEFDGLMSFSYNCGETALLGSTLYKNVVAGVRDADTIIANFQAWSRAGGVTLPGLYKRRTAEANIFLNGVYDSSH